MSIREVETHVLKTVEPYFTAVENGHKNFEVRKFDRDFQVGDYLQLTHYDPKTNNLGKYVFRKITYILNDPTYVKSGYVVLGLNDPTIREELKYKGPGKKRIRKKRAKQDKRLKLLPELKKRSFKLLVENKKLKMDRDHDLVFFTNELCKADERIQTLDKLICDSLLENYELEQKLFNLKSEKSIFKRISNFLGIGTPDELN
jgi:hypothetical protein